MRSYYWFKLYDEILDDPKMGRMPDRLYRRCIEMFAFANRNNQEGRLPSVADMAWVLRCREDDLWAEMEELAGEPYLILTKTKDGWQVTQFATRQERVGDSERQKRKRERDRKSEYYGHEDDTGRDEESHDTVTECDTDIDIDAESESEESRGEQNSARAGETEPEMDICQAEDREDDEFGRIQEVLETVIGLPITPGDIPPIQEMVKLGVTRADIQGAAEWMASNGKTTATWASFPGRCGCRWRSAGRRFWEGAIRRRMGAAGAGEKTADRMD